MSIEAMEQALEALKNYVHVVTSSNDPKDFGGVVDGGEPARQAITALRQAIAEAEKQEPVAIGEEWKPCVKLPVVVHVREQRKGETHVSTREGITPVKEDDLIMRGVAGEEYPIGRELFNRTYTFDTAPVHAIDMNQECVDETAKGGHEPVPNDYDRSIHSNPDAQAWAKFFMATVKEKEWCIDDIDEGLMLGWFANAMMAMYDHTIAINKQIDLTWVGFTAAELEKIIPMLVKSFINHDEKTLFLLVGAMLVDIEDQLKEKNGYGSEVYGPTTDFIGPSVVKAISKREWVGLTDEAIWLEYQQLWPFHPAEEPTLAKDIAKFARAIEAKLKEKNSL